MLHPGCGFFRRITMSLMWRCSSKVWSWLSANHMYFPIGSNTYVKMLITHQGCCVDCLQALQKTPLSCPATVLCIILQLCSTQSEVNKHNYRQNFCAAVHICPSDLSGSLSAPHRCFLYKIPLWHAFFVFFFDMATKCPHALLL